MVAKVFLELCPATGRIGQGIQIKRSFEGDQARGQVRVKDEIQVPAFEKPFGRSEEKDFVFQYGTANIDGGVPAIEKRSATAGTRNIIGIECAAAVKKGQAAVPVVCAAARDHVHDASGGMAEFSFIAPRDNLKFQNRILVELRGRASIEVVAIGHAID